MNNIKNEKAAIVYYSVRQENEERKGWRVSLQEFLNKYEKLFPMIGLNPYHNANNQKSKKDIRISRESAYKQIHKQLRDSTLEDILVYRNNFIVVSERVIPKELIQLAKEKGLYIDLKKNTDTFLSGYNIYYKKVCVTAKPYQLSEADVREVIKSFPSSKEAIVKQENDLLELLHNESVNKSRKMSALNGFKMLYTTHDFKTRINRYLFKYCTDKELALAAFGLCSRAGIVNLQNNKPIILRFCKADSKAKKKLKRTRSRKKK